MCSSASSLVLFTTVLEPLAAMVLTAVVLLVFDRRLLKKWGGGEGEEGAWVAGYRPMDAALLAWVRYGVEFLPAAILGALSLSVFSLCFLFPSFPRYIL